MDLKKISDTAKDLLENKNVKKATEVARNISGTAKNVRENEKVKETIATASNKVSEVRSNKNISSKEDTKLSTSQKTTNDYIDDYIAKRKKCAELEKQEEAEREAKEAKREAKRKARNEAYKKNNPQLMKKYKELAQEGTAFAYIEICQALEHESYFNKGDADQILNTVFPYTLIPGEFAKIYMYLKKEKDFARLKDLKMHAEINIGDPNVAVLIPQIEQTIQEIEQTIKEQEEKNKLIKEEEKRKEAREENLFKWIGIGCGIPVLIIGGIISMFLDFFKSIFQTIFQSFFGIFQ